MKNDRLQRIANLTRAYLEPSAERDELLRELANLEQDVIINAHAALREAVLVELQLGEVAAEIDAQETAAITAKLDAAIAAVKP